MTRFESTVDSLVLWGARAGVGPGYTVEAAAVRLAEDIAELRDNGGIPPHVHTVITVLPQHRVLEIRVEGVSVEADPDHTTSRDVMHTVFEIASDHNIAGQQHRARRADEHPRVRQQPAARVAQGRGDPAAGR